MIFLNNIIWNLVFKYFCCFKRRT